jgi:hypothetical protein
MMMSLALVFLQEERAHVAVGVAWFQRVCRALDVKVCVRACVCVCVCVCEQMEVLDEDDLINGNIVKQMVNAR